MKVFLATSRWVAPLDESVRTALSLSLRREVPLKVFMANQPGGSGSLDARYMDEVALRKDSINEISILCSFHYFRRIALSNILGRFPGLKVNLFADSGGFSAATLGTPVRLKEYVDWLHKNGDSISLYANLDVIGDPIKSKRNLAVLESEGLSPMPVFHVGSDFKYLDEMLETKNYIALGGMVPYMKDQRKQLGNWCHKVFERIEKRATAKVSCHGFGVGTSWNIARGFPWQSIDSSAWTSAFQFRSVSVFDDKLERFVGIDLGSGAEQAIFNHARLLHSYGFAPTDFYPASKFTYVKAGALSVMSMLRAERFLTARGGRREVKRKVTLTP